MAARAGVEPTTLRLKAIDATNVPPCPTMSVCRTNAHNIIFLLQYYKHASNLSKILDKVDYRPNIYTYDCLTSEEAACQLKSNDV